MASKTKAMLSLALASFGFGAGSAVLKLMLRDFPDLRAMELVQIRLLFSGFCLLALGTWQQKRAPAIRKQDIKRFAALGILGIFVVQYFLMYSVSQIYVGLATFTQATATLMICAYSIVVLNERMTAWRAMALIAGFSGLAVILWSPEMLQSENLLNLGILAALLSALGKCFYILYGKMLQQYYNSMVMIGYAMLFGSAFALLFARPWQDIRQYGGEPRLIGYMALYILFCTALPFALYFEGLKQAPVSVAGITNIIEPVGGTVMAFFLTGELLQPLQLIGIALILAGVLLAQGEVLRTERRK